MMEVIITLSESSNSHVFHRVDSESEDRSACGRLQPAEDHICDREGREYTRQKGSQTAVIPRAVAEETDREKCDWCYDEDSRTDDTLPELYDSVRHLAGIEPNGERYYTKRELKKIRDQFILADTWVPDEMRGESDTGGDSA